VSEFVSSGMRRSEFCRTRGLSFSTLDRHLKERRWKRKTRSAPADGKLVPVELALRRPAAEHQACCGLAVGVGLSGGRRPGIADVPTQRLPELTPAAWATQHYFAGLGNRTRLEVLKL
jgi:hypothetical protein